MKNDIRPAKKPPHRKSHSATSRTTANDFQSVLAFSNQTLTSKQQRFSKTVHKPVVEEMHEITSKTIARHTIMLGAATGSLVATIVVVFLAAHSGFTVSPLTSISALIAGGILGLLVEVALLNVAKLLKTN